MYDYDVSTGALSSAQDVSTGAQDYDVEKEYIGGGLLPTLMIKGSLLAHDYGPNQETLNTFVPINYILERFDDLIPLEQNGTPKRKITSLADKVLVLRSQVASGKSSILPPELYFKYAKRTNKSIMVGEPRISLTKMVPEDIATYHTPEKVKGTGRDPLILGQNLGYKSKLLRVSIKKGITFCTIGVLQQNYMTLSPQDLMNTYMFILIDEVHLVSENPSLGALFLSKKFMEANWKDPNCPFLIVMSGTIDPFIYADYLLSSVPKPDRYKSIIQVIGRSYPVETQFLKYSSSDMYASIKKILIDIHSNNTSDLPSGKNIHKDLIDQAKSIGDSIKDNDKIPNEELVIYGSADVNPTDIIIFISGKEGMFLENMVNSLNSKIKLFTQYPVKGLLVNSKEITANSISYREAVDIPIDQLKVMVNGKPAKVARKCLFATIAISIGATIHSLKYAINTCWIQQGCFVPFQNMSIMLTKPNSKADFQQRMARVGRSSPGFAWAVCTEESYKMLNDQDHPEIIRMDSTSDILIYLIREFDSDSIITKYSLDQFIKENHINHFSGKSVDLNKIDLIYRPCPDMLHFALEKLFTLGCINSNSEPTTVGIIISRLKSLTLENARMILSGYYYDVDINILVTLAAIIETNATILTEDESVLLPQIMYTELSSSIKGGATKTKEPISFNMLNSKEYTKLYLIIGDQYIYSLLVMLYLMFNFSNEKVNPSKSLGDLCKKCNTSYKDVVVALEKRDEIILNLSSIGLNPYEPCSKGKYPQCLTQYKSVIEFVSIIKQCLFEGYKMNLSIKKAHQNSDGTYTNEYFDRRTSWKHKILSPFIIPTEIAPMYSSSTVKGSNDIFGKVSNKSLVTLKDLNPKYILLYKIGLKPPNKGIIYKQETSAISVLDGFVDVDETYDAL